MIIIWDVIVIIVFLGAVLDIALRKDPEPPKEENDSSLGEGSEPDFVQNFLDRARFVREVRNIPRTKPGERRYHDRKK